MSLLHFVLPTELTFVKRTFTVSDIYTYIFKPASPLYWRAGQHGMIEIKKPNGKVSRRMFSLSSSPSEHTVSITTHWLGEEKASDFKKALWNLQPGDKAKLRGPIGSMYLRETGKEHVFIAGGIGITPFRAMIVQAVSDNPDMKGTLLYANRDQASVLFRGELERLSSRLQKFQIVFVTKPDQITASEIRNACDNLHDTIFYVAGPPSMIKAYKKIMKELGVKKSQIKNDLFLGSK